MKQLIAVVTITVVLFGCSTTRQGPRVVEGNEMSVVITAWESNQGFSGALALADTHCAKYGKKARYARNVADFTRAYDCVKE